MSTFTRALKNTVSLAGADLISRALNFVLIAVLVRRLTPEDFGGYITVITLVGLLAPLADVGLSQVLVREIAAQRTRASQLLFNGLVITLGMAALGWLALAAVAWFSHYPPSLRPLILLSGLAVVGNTLMQTSGAALRSFERMEIQALVTSSLLLVASAIGIGLALSGYGLTAQVALSVVAALVGAMLTLAIVHRWFAPLQWSFDPHLGGMLVMEAMLVFALAASSAILRWMDVLILGQVRSLPEVAVFGTATKVMDLAFVVTTSAGAAMLPVISSRWREAAELARGAYSRALRLFVAFGVAIAVGGVVLAEPIVVTLFGPAYQAAAWPLRILACAFFLQAANAPAWVLLLASGEGLRKFLPAIGAVALGNIILNLLLAPRWSYVGSAVALLVTATASFFLRRWIVRDYFADPPRVRTVLLRPLLAGMAMGVILIPLRSVHPAISVPAGALVFAFFLALLGELKAEPYHHLVVSLHGAWQRLNGRRTQA